MDCNLKKKLRAGELLVGTWVTIGHPDIPDIIEEMGLDWIVFDTEHAPIGPESLSRMIQAIDPSVVCPLVRLGGAEAGPVKAALDMGAHGVIFPLVSTAEEAKSAVSLTKYPPKGVRGVAPRKAARYGRSFLDYVRTANDDLTVGVQIETVQAVENIGEIVLTEGVDLAFVGPTDLTMSMGLLDDRGNPKVIEAMGKVVRATVESGKAPGVLAATPAEAEKFAKIGFKFIGLGSDVRFLQAGAKGFIDAVRASTV